MMDPIPAYRRLIIVEAVKAGESVAEVAERFVLSETAVQNFLKLRIDRRV